MTSFNDVIRERRLMLGLSLAELSRRSGVSKAYLHRLERPGSAIHPSVEVARRLAEVLGIDLTAVLTGTTEGRYVPHGLRDYLAQSEVPARDLAALAALAPFVSEDTSAAEWAFALHALQRSVLRTEEPR